MRRRHTDKLYVSPSKMARCARRWFDICYRSPEFEDAPPLPLSPQERFWHMSMKGAPLGYLLGRYAASLEAHDYEVFDHPRPAEFVRGLMACSTVPAEVRQDPEMLRRFPPEKLHGLDERTMLWSASASSGQLEAA